MKWAVHMTKRGAGAFVKPVWKEIVIKEDLMDVQRRHKKTSHLKL